MYSPAAWLQPMPCKREPSPSLAPLPPVLPPGPLPPVPVYCHDGQSEREGGTQTDRQTDRQRCMPKSSHPREDLDGPIPHTGMYAAHTHTHTHTAAAAVAALLHNSEAYCEASSPCAGRCGRDRM